MPTKQGQIGGAFTNKIMIVDDDGNITRTLSLPYPGRIIDVSDMPDDEWEGHKTKLQDIQVDVDKQKGVVNLDARGLPIIKSKA